MSVVEIVRFAVRGLVANRLRSLLTMLGIIIGIAAVILLTALGNGASQYIQGQIAGLGANSITILPRQPPESAGTSGRPLTTGDVRALADPQGAPDVASVSPVAQLSASVDAGRSRTDATVVGSTPTYFPGANVQIGTGRAYTDADVEAGRKVILLGRTVADDLFGVGSDPVGRDVLVRGVPFDVIGTLAPAGQGQGLSNPDENVLAPITAVQGSLTGFGDLSQIVVQARSTEAQAAAESEINSILDRRHGIEEPDNRDYQVLSARQLADVLDDTLGAFTLLLAAIAAISLVVGGIGITNIMLVSVTERTREIGIRKALGAPPSAILGQFLVESIILSVVGGMLGVAVGYAGTLVPLGDFRPVVLPSAVVAAVAVSAAIGIFFGAYPARRAARLRPIEALRRE
ncbi:putative ABC transport system permease protein [Actinomycetospora succinea]|uniref:Putative ABC transport system permease protein n=1 Tax=Actinomycetospora succinea TaxID=663603 RepID=A0A4R6VSL9_9PSEU|nr:ABC transporter permease [Actinomycetospora succinea]TDQ62910.1 putative ABC transport system permease protein [Actinomycetospora succinea]